MKRVFVFQDFKSQKFWSIEVVGTDVTVNYGKLGTDGQTQVKNYATTEEAEKAAGKLIAEKTKKGYVETAEETAREMKVEAKKYTLSYDEYENNVNLLDKILKDKHLSEYKQITIGCWDYEGGDCSALLQGMIENKEKFAQIEGLFWGDIEQEEQEISWIEQADISPLLDAMPKLKDLKIKGTNNLRLGKTSRPELRSLEIISGGLPTEVVEDILGSDFPNLEKLILYVGVEDYGFEADIEIFRPLFSKERFPKLTYLGIVNSEEQDKIVEMFLESDILPQLETMDVSAGTLKDEGAPRSFDELRELLTGCGRGCFLKPRYGSGAGGVMAIRYQPNRNKWVVYTTLQQVDGVIHNTKRIHRLSTEKEMIPLAEAVMQTEAILEEWIPKEQLQGENYDLRVVCRESEIDYIVVRCSKGSITNLHLNNKAHWWNELSLPEVVRQQIYFQCQEAVQSLDLQYAGVDVLIERGTDIPYIIEVNGQGDHVYQDMFAHNSIYIQQIKNIKKRYNHANR